MAVWFGHSFTGTPYGFVKVKDPTFTADVIVNKLETGTNPCPPAIIHSIHPQNNSLLRTRKNNLTFESDINAQCRYSTVPGVNFNSMTKLNGTDQILHSFTLDAENSTTYTFYVKCIDEFNDINELFKSEINLKTATHLKLNFKYLFIL